MIEMFVLWSVPLSILTMPSGSSTAADTFLIQTSACHSPGITEFKRRIPSIANISIRVFCLSACGLVQKEKMWGVSDSYWILYK